MKKITKLFTTSFAAFCLFLLASVVSASTLEVTQTEKEALYEQYVKIVDEVVAEHEGTILEVVPIELFTDEDWIAPEEFKKIALSRANTTIQIIPEDANGITPFAVVSGSKSKDFISGDFTRTVTAYGSFETGHNSSAGRQVFTWINSVTSSMSGNGTWKQTGYVPNLIDGGRTYRIELSGTFTQSTLTSPHRLVYEFYCSAVGSVS